MKRKLFIGLIFLQAIFISALFVYIVKSKNTLGISISSMNSKFIQKIPISGLNDFYEPKPNTVEEVHKDWLSTIPKYTINNDLLNERYNYDIEKKDGVFRIITLGDSFTFGENLDTKNNYPELLEDKLNARCIDSKYEVINLGVRGYDIEYMTERYRLRGSKYNPDLVIVLLGTFQLYRMKQDLIVRGDVLMKENPTLSGEEVNDKTNRELITDFGWNSLLKWQEIQIKKLLNTIKSKALISTFSFSCTNNIFQSNWLAFDCWPFVEYDKLLKKEVQVKGGYYINTLTRNKTLSFPDGHPNGDGYEIISEELYSYLINNKIVPCETIKQK